MKYYDKYQIIFIFFILTCLGFTINDYFERLDCIDRQKPLEVKIESKECKESIFRRKRSSAKVSAIYFRVNGKLDTIYTDLKRCNELPDKIKVIKFKNDYIEFNKDFTRKKLIYLLLIISFVSILPFKLLINRTFKNKKNRQL